MWGPLSRTTLIPVNQPDAAGNVGDLSELRGTWPPAGAIVVTDRYMFKDERGVRNGLVPLLLAALPAEPHEVRVDVTLVADKAPTEAWSGNPEGIRRGVEELLLEERPFLDLDLTVALVTHRTPDLHDRRVFMSYLYVQSGASFHEYGSGTKSRLTPTPLTDPTAIGTFAAELRAVRDVVTGSGRAYVSGSRRNKLFGAAR